MRSVLIELQQPFGELAGLIDVAVGEHGEKGAAEQIGIVRIGLEHVEVIGRRGAGVALGAGMARGQIIAGGIVGSSSCCGRAPARRRLGGERQRQAQSMAAPTTAACRDSSE